MDETLNIEHLTALLDAELSEIEESDKSLAGNYDPTKWDQTAASYYGLGGYDQNAVKAGRDYLSGLQDGYVARMKRHFSSFVRHIQRYPTLDLGAAFSQFEGDIAGMMNQFFSTAYQGGALMMGNPYYQPQQGGLQRPDKAFIRKAVRQEMRYFKRLIDKASSIARTNVTAEQVESSFNPRIDRYASAVEAMKWNGMLAASGPQHTIIWELNGAVARHCPTCISIAAANPYTRETLPTVPRAGDTVCLYQCHCSLKFVGGPESYVGGGVPLPLDAACSVTSAAGGAVSEPVQDEFDKLYRYMNVVRAKIESNIDRMMKRNLIKLRTEINKEIINKAKGYGVRVVPRWSVADIITNVRSLEAQGAALISDTAALRIGMYVYAVEGGSLKVGRVNAVGPDYVQLDFGYGSIKTSHIDDLAIFLKPQTSAAEMVGGPA